MGLIKPFINQANCMHGYLTIEENHFRCINCKQFSDDMHYHKCSSICRSCLLGASPAWACPICKKKIDKNIPLTSNYFLENFIQRKVECYFAYKGCSWTGPVFQCALHCEMCSFNSDATPNTIIKEDELGERTVENAYVPYNNGSLYVGNIVNGKKHGFGKEFDGLNRYVGEWQNDEKHGSGKFVFDTMSFYIGDFARNQFNGKGTFKEATGDIYQGDWVMNTREGFGIFTDADGNVYRGFWKNNMRHGTGVSVGTRGQILHSEWNEDCAVSPIGKIWFPSGKIYRGQINECGQQDGKGRITYPDGRFFEGEWDKDSKRGMCITNKCDGQLMEGKYSFGDLVMISKFVFHNGDKFEGKYSVVLKKGSGTIQYANAKYEGEVNKDFKKQGQGVFTDSENNVYKGNFENDVKTGQGTMTYANGDSYEGAWLNDKPHGQGKYFSKSEQSTYFGPFENGQKHGKGFLKLAENEFYTGVWKNDQSPENGKIVSSMNDEPDPAKKKAGTTQQRIMQKVSLHDDYDIQDEDANNDDYDYDEDAYDDIDDEGFGMGARYHKNIRNKNDRW